jgi:predicted nucleic acid-binding protein
MTIIDTSVLIDFLTNRDTPKTEWIERNVEKHPCGLTDLVLFEVLQGIRTDKQLAAVQEELRAFELWPTMGPGIAVKAAENYRSLRSLGITVRKAVDCLIATFCIEYGHALLHNDRDFDGFEKHLGLKVIHP